MLQYLCSTCVYKLSIGVFTFICSSVVSFPMFVDQVHIRYVTETIRIHRYSTQLMSHNGMFTIFTIFSIFMAVSFTIFEIVIAIIYVRKLHAVVIGSQTMTNEKWIKLAVFSCLKDTEMP